MLPFRVTRGVLHNPKPDDEYVVSHGVGAQARPMEVAPWTLPSITRGRNSPEKYYTHVLIVVTWITIRI